MNNEGSKFIAQLHMTLCQVSHVRIDGTFSCTKDIIAMENLWDFAISIMD